MNVQRNKFGLCPRRLFFVWTTVFVAFGQTTGTRNGAAAEERARQPGASAINRGDSLRLRLLDPQGKPVPGAKVGLSASFGDTSYLIQKWIYLEDPSSLDPTPPEITSDDDGIAVLRGGRRFINNFCVVARHEARGLVALRNLSKAAEQEEVTLTLVPECRVLVRLDCKELEKSSEDLQRNWINIAFEDLSCLEAYSLDADFEFFLPPGTYQLRGQGGDGRTLHFRRELVVPDGVQSLTLTPIHLTAKPVWRLTGKPAPELSDVFAWEPAKVSGLSDFRGKVVLLDFWGHWCQACVAKLPRLVELHDQYHERGLVIIGIHVDQGGRIESRDAYQTYHESLRKDLLAGRRIPFPVALVKGKDVPHRGGAGMAICQIAADYGVENFPTMILLDGEGNVVGPFIDRPQDLKKLEQLLAE